jgi:hypothetical protein
MVGRVGFEPSTIGLKVWNKKYNDIFINVLLRNPMRHLHNRAELIHVLQNLL